MTLDTLREHAQEVLCQAPDLCVFAHLKDCPMRYFNDFAQAVGLEQLAADANRPKLGLATTRELLAELEARGETENYYTAEGNDIALGARDLLDRLPGSMLDYRTVGDR